MMCKTEVGGEGWQENKKVGDLKWKFHLEEISRGQSKWQQSL